MRRWVWRGLRVLQVKEWKIGFWSFLFFNGMMFAFWEMRKLRDLIDGVVGLVGLVGLLQLPWYKSIDSSQMGRKPKKWTDKCCCEIAKNWFDIGTPFLSNNRIKLIFLYRLRKQLNYNACYIWLYYRLVNKKSKLVLRNKDILFVCA